MAPSKKSSSTILPAWLRIVLTAVLGPGRAFTLVVLLVAVFLIAWYFVWQHVRSHVLGSDRYMVPLEKVLITPLPAWIHSDVRGDVFRNASLDPPLSILDGDLSARIAHAFSLHPWVEKVERVTKHADGQVNVELVYRRPVCMIEATGELLPVDIEGVLLPGGDFSPIEKQSYPCMAGIDSRPMGPVGQHWGDIRIVEGAEIAAAIGPAWQQLRLYRLLTLTNHGAPAAAERNYELVTRVGTRIFWGPAPSAKAPNDLAASEKLARLVQYAADHATLDGPSGPQQLDIRSLPPPRKKQGD
jgi:hypothetical protein